MSRQRLPGLNYVIFDESVDPNPMKLVGFNFKSFSVNGLRKYGNCRAVSEFRKRRTIYEGSFGTIYKVYDKECKDKSLYALKKIELPRDSKGNLEVMPQNILRQITALKKLNHPHIVNLKDVVVGEELERNYLLLDLCSYSLERVIEEVDSVYLQHKQVKNIMSQMLYGLEYLHQMNIIHRDLCPRNILFTESGVLKISDFASARQDARIDMTPGKGLRWYRAPEILFGGTQYCKGVDMWAVGCIFAEMLYQRPLFRGHFDGEIVRSMIHLLGTPTETTMPGFSSLPVPRIYRLRRQMFNRVRSYFSTQTMTTVYYVLTFLKYNPALRMGAMESRTNLYYQEHPLKCSDEELLLTLRQSTKL